MKLFKYFSLLLTVLALSGCTAKAAEQKSAKRELLFVVHSQKAQYSSGKLVLEGVSPVVSYFTDRPVRKAGGVDMKKFVEAWSADGKNSFKVDPPNAAVISDAGGGEKYSEVPVTLSSPNYNTARKMLSFDIQFIDENKFDENSSMNEVSLFIDDQGEFPGQFAGGDGNM